EAVPTDLATEVTQSLAVPTIGIGAGPGCDGQVLVTPDMLGITCFEAKYIKRYAELSSIMQRAAELFVSDVKEKRFPTPEQGY
ncbi:MAG: 3-methyl-2-oxobutanoate hydroxymethyltransferase, partial [Planctomycetes bacterium]|nr:3-methyl-2-oxobutanoate hydroxymethyltransferase [Planctomycetota bacterium]